MDKDLKEKILNTIRKEHGLAIDNKDPMFALLTANEIILEQELKQLNSIFSDQLIEMELVTKNYLKNAKELLEKRLTLALKESKAELQTIQQATPIPIENKNHNLTIPLLCLITGILIGYGISLFIL